MAAFGTAVCWTLSAIFFEQGIKRIGILSVNFIKVVIAFVLLAVTAAIMRGMPLPLDATGRTWVFLLLSGIVGFVIGDTFLFTAYNTVGPRVGMLFMALSPPMTAGIAYLFLGESIGQRGFLGMSLVICGIIMTIFGKQNSLAFFKMARDDKRGYVCAFMSSLGGSISMNLTKTGVSGYDAVSGTQIRILAAIIGFGLMSLFVDRGSSIRRAVKNLEGIKYTSIGAVFGPFLGVAFSLYAVQRISAGIVSTLIGLTPVLILVPEMLFYRKKVRFLEIAGAFIAVCGTAVFFL